MFVPAVFRSLVFHSLVVATAFLSGVSAAEEAPRVKIATSAGDIVVEVYPDKAPRTVENFLRYVKDGQYVDTIFHRVIPGFMVQGGGYDSSMTEKPTRAPIPLEANNGLRNDRGTLAMARMGNPNSATAQFFINLADNATLNAPKPDGYGYAVFGRVVSGMEVVDAMATLPTTTVRNYANVPIRPVVINAAFVDATPVETKPAATSASASGSGGAAGSTSRKPDARKGGAAAAESAASNQNATSGAGGQTTPAGKTTSASTVAKGQDRKPGASNCPVETTIIGDYRAVQTLKFQALTDRLFTKAELEAYYQELVTTQKQSRNSYSPSGDPYYSRYAYNDTPRQRALSGCVDNVRNNCDDFIYDGGSYAPRDTITPRLTVYQCHHDAGWPSASDAAPTRGKSSALTASTNAGAKSREPSSEKANDSQKAGDTQKGSDTRKAGDTRKENDHAPYIASKCVRIVQAGTGVGSAFKRIHNDCGVPVSVAFCLEAPGPIHQCLNRNRYGLSDIIAPGKSQLTADAIDGSWSAWFFVCDMSHPKKQACLVPQDLAGAGPFRD